MLTLLLFLTLQVDTLHYTAPEPVYFEARITQYGWTGNKTASGKWPEEGMCAVSDRTIPFGAIVSFAEGGYCVVEDRTAKWVAEKFPHLTVDLFSKNPEGRHYKLVALIN